MKPDRCPEGHDLGPGTCSRSWDTEMKCHVLYCNRCDSRITLRDGGEWEVYFPGKGWVKVA